jgi:hypothetical protein
MPAQAGKQYRKSLIPNGFQTKPGMTKQADGPFCAIATQSPAP